MNTGEREIEFSVISPVYRGAGMVDELVYQIKQALLSGGIASYEIILVEDGSPDDSWLEIEQICGKHDEVIGVKLTRNFGQHPAISAGLRRARGRYVAVLDCDLQDDPKYLCEILDMLKAGAPVVFTRKASREHSVTKNLATRFFNIIFNRLVEVRSVKGDSQVGSFSGLNRKVVDEFNKIKDAHRHYLMIIRWLGFPVTYLDVVHRARLEGRSSYTLSKLFQHAIDGITSQSRKVLHIFVLAGFLICLVAFVSLIALVLLYVLNGFKEGWASVMAVMLLSTGIIVFALGIVGIYIGQILDQARQRPLYVIEKVMAKYE